MAVATTDTRKLTPLEHEALAVRAEAAHRLLPRCMTPDDRIDLLAAVVWPSHPLLGLTSSTSSDTGSSSAGPDSESSAEPSPMPADCGLGVMRLCKLPDCPNELDSSTPTTGVWADVCDPCRRGVTLPGSLYRASGGGPGLPLPQRTMEAHPKQGLTVRELEVLKLMADGHKNAEVAEKLFISIETVKSHVRHLLDKSGCRTRTHLVAFALRNSLIT